MADANALYPSRSFNPFLLFAREGYGVVLTHLTIEALHRDGSGGVLRPPGNAKKT
jgi:hypothetical protein